MKKIYDFEKFLNENLRRKLPNNNPLVTIDDFFESFPNFKVDWMEDNIDDFAHSEPEEDFDEYIIIDDTIAKEKEYVLMDDNDNSNEIWVYTDNNNMINGYAFNKD